MKHNRRDANEPEPCCEICKQLGSECGCDEREARDRYERLLNQYASLNIVVERGNHDPFYK